MPHMEVSLCRGLYDIQTVGDNIPAASVPENTLHRDNHPSQSRKMRILQVVPTYYPAVRYGGPIRSVHGLCAALVRLGHRVEVYTTNVDGPGICDVPLDRPVDLHGVQVHYFPIGSPRRLYRSAAMKRRLHEAIADFDLVHLHSVYLWPTWAAARAARAARIPYIISPRGMLVKSMIRRKSRWLKTAWITLIERRSLAQAAAVHVTAELEAANLRALGLRLPPIRCIPNGVDFPDAEPPPPAVPGTAHAQPYALFLSRIHWVKGLDRLIDAWRQVPELQLVIAGPDEGGYRQTLQRLVASYGLGDRVQFIGKVGDDDKWALYRNAMFFVLPSYSENFGNAVAEAMAMGVAVIVTPQVGIAATVAAAEAGIVTSNDPASLGAACRRLSADPALRQHMGGNGECAAKRLFSWPAIASAMEKVYREAIGASAAPSGPASGVFAASPAPRRRR